MDQEEHFHEIAGYKVADNPVPRSTIAVFLFIFFIAAISWITIYGF